MNNFDDDYGGYYGGGCFSGDSLIHLSNGSCKQVRDLIAGQDRIATPDGQGANVICVVEMDIVNGRGK